ncbi:hypothetical protein CEP45_04770 [Mergibacter septicus]|uniref:hypothetical protein n=1 Tax=Mergibacter septicus TaxID=221402 RepID=UPI001C74729A|nr:hypothetical protein [Mergibacter septicus]QDJ13202.1 hypothetical protein CEP45_04770 [Mergibacter septicus]
MSNVRHFDFTKEFENTITQSLVTTFGIDWLLFEDKVGGNVDTIHNVRQGIYATAEEENRYRNREKYNSHDYHSDPNYIAYGKKDKELQQKNKLFDQYTGKIITQNQKRDLDHIISAKEIHDDPGRILAERSGIELANQDTNFNSTTSTINRSKQAKSVNEYRNQLNSAIQNVSSDILKKEEQLKKMPKNTPEEQHRYRKVEDKINKLKNKKKELESIDPNLMKKADDKARKAYNDQINQYYTSKKFLSNTGKMALKQGVAMGTRQALGLVLAEFWFELKEQIPDIFRKHKNNFELSTLFNDLKELIGNIFKRLKIRLKEIFSSFIDGSISGAISSIATTAINIFATTGKTLVRAIREIWNYLVKAIKLILFNPDKLSTGALMKEVATILGMGLSVVVGSSITTSLTMTFTFPFGDLVATFLGALTTGLMTLGLTYFLQYSSLCQKIWDFFDWLTGDNFAKVEAQYNEINRQLDEFILKISKIEFNLNANELLAFSNQLKKITSEYDRTNLLATQAKKLNINLGYDPNNIDDFCDWFDK